RVGMAAEGTHDRSDAIIPRASDLNRLEITIELGALGIMAPGEIAKRLNVAPGKAQYLVDLGQWFGFIDETCSDLTERGRRFVGQVGRRRAIVREVLWSRPVVRQVFGHPDWPEDPEAAAEAVIADRTSCRCTRRIWSASSARRSICRRRPSCRWRWWGCRAPNGTGPTSGASRRSRDISRPMSPT
ncbi:MAG: hypothetical protein ABEN55_22945, partial [Bradymonadaceae bacterium]